MPDPVDLNDRILSAAERMPEYNRAQKRAKKRAIRKEERVWAVHGRRWRKP